MTVLNKIIDNTKKFIEANPNKCRKDYGQFFTSKDIAIFMARLFTLSKKQTTLRVLDPGAGSGILATALIERIATLGTVQHVDLVCYETDMHILPVLQSNLEYLKNATSLSISYTIIKDNYILQQAPYFNSASSSQLMFDVVIANPPYMKLNKCTAEAQAMFSLCYGTPNLYFLFAAVSLFNLVPNGELVYIIPRSWSSGSYFTKFRHYLLTQGKLIHIHLFDSRKNVFQNEHILQETMIIKVKKTKLQPSIITVTKSLDGHFNDFSSIQLPYDLIVDKKQYYVYLITSEKELSILKRVHKWHNTLIDLGLKMKTGLIVNFRTKQFLHTKNEPGTVPLFYPSHISNGKIVFPSNESDEYISTNRQGLVQQNKNYLFVKRCSSKEEKRRIQCGIYLAKNFKQYEVISTQNKLNFIDAINGTMSKCLTYGLYVLFNSSLYDGYYRILNGSTQVNSTEINSMPIPSLDIIQKLGQRLLKANTLSEQICDDILEEYYV